MNRMLQGGLMEYMAGGQVNPAAAMFGSNTEKISNMSSPLHGVDTGRMQIGYPKAAYGMSMDTYNMGGYSPSYSIPQGQMGMPVMKQTNDAGMSYAMPVMYQTGGYSSKTGKSYVGSVYPYEDNYNFDKTEGFEYYGLPPVTHSIDSQGMPAEAYTLPTVTVSAQRIPPYFKQVLGQLYYDTYDKLETSNKPGDKRKASQFHNRNYGKSMSDMDPELIEEAERIFNKKYNKSGKVFKYKKQEGGQAMPNSQDMAMAMAQQEGAPMPPMQQQAPEQNQEAMMQELTALAQAALSGDEEAIKIIEQLPEEQQQMILQIMEQMQAQGQGAEAGMNAGMEQGMQEGMEQMAMMYGGIMNTENSNKKNTTKKSKSKKKSYTSNQMKNGGYSVRKSSMNKLNKLYNTLGIPC